MPDPLRPSLRVVEPIEPPPARPRGPGIAFVAIVIYALLFAGALWYFKRGSREKPRVPSLGSQVAPETRDRATLLGGIGLSPAARQKYFARIASDRCDCGCTLSLRACLERDQSCVRSPALASARLGTASGPAP